MIPVVELKLLELNPELKKIYIECVFFAFSIQLSKKKCIPKIITIIQHFIGESKLSLLFTHPDNSAIKKILGTIVLTLICIHQPL